MDVLEEMEEVLAVGRHDEDVVEEGGKASWISTHAVRQADEGAEGAHLRRMYSWAACTPLEWFSSFSDWATFSNRSSSRSA